MAGKRKGMNGAQEKENSASGDIEPVYSPALPSRITNLLLLRLSAGNASTPVHAHKEQPQQLLQQQQQQQQQQQEQQQEETTVEDYGIDFAEFLEDCNIPGSNVMCCNSSGHEMDMAEVMKYGDVNGYSEFEIEEEVKRMKYERRFSALSYGLEGVPE
ncbi:hypothetical protein J5N97_008479 [Dioscorea zingiberensis]|uniref:Uncharacterized protein n=1 Tax=Dioscorea zingiberensis TaxID=325984 RepID=A0A9D5HKU6_9LILI|nr:hypothetical protein J5N97_008479 [Dioscorea zingiberensis]